MFRFRLFPASALGAVLIVLLSVASIGGAFAGRLPRSSPEAQGVSSVALQQVVETLDREIPGMHSVMILRHGEVIAEGWWAPYAPGHRHVLYSLSKSFTSTAVGFAVAEGKVSIDDPVLKYFPDDAPAAPGPELRSMRVRDLLTMSTGHREESPMSPETMTVRSFLAHPVPLEPGSRFLYNTPATFMQSAIVQKVTGQTVLEYLQPRLFEPLGIRDPAWETNRQGISLGGYGLRVRTEDIAKFGQWYLQKGQWAGRQLLPAEWVELATSRQVSNGTQSDSDWSQGYGFQFWRCRHNAFRGDGAFGQYCVVVPDQDLVVAITGGLRDMQAVLNVLWAHLLPAMEEGRLPSRRSARNALRQTLDGLALAPASGEPTSSMAGPFLHRTYVFPDNDQRISSIRLEPGRRKNELMAVMAIDGRSVRLPCGYRAWKPGRGPVPAGPLAWFPDEPLATTYGWEGTVLRLKVCAVETPFHFEHALAFGGDTVTLDTELNVAFGPTQRPRLTGRAE